MVLLAWNKISFPTLKLFYVQSWDFFEVDAIKLREYGQKFSVISLTFNTDLTLVVGLEQFPYDQFLTWNDQISRDDVHES